MKYTLKALRQKYELTQKQAAMLIGVSESTWVNWEKRKTFPDVPFIDRIEKTFNVSYNDIIFLTPITVKPLKSEQEV